MTDGYNSQKEIAEAIRAGERAKGSLREARERLDGARAWGMWDMLGGGLVSGLVKHSRINEASDYLEQAKCDLRVFRRELGDVRGIPGLDIEIDGFLTFADLFLDGFLVDLVVQTKIKDAQQQIDTAISRVDHILARLRAEQRR